jgi:hypothetical protein
MSAWPTPEQIRAEYDRRPALAPFARRPISLALAQAHGLRSAFRALQRARALLAVAA